MGWNVSLSVFADEIAKDFAEQLDAVRAEGLRQIDLRAAWGKNVLDLSDEELTEINRLLADRGVTVACIGSPIGKSPITERFDAQLPRFRRALEVARRVGTPNIRIFSFYLPEGEPPARYRDEVLRRMRRMAEIAQREAPEVLLLHENEREIYGEDGERCREIIDAVGAPNLKSIFDPANYVLVGVHPFTDAYPLLIDSIAYLHIKDATFDTQQIRPAGEGDGQLRETLAALRARGWEGVLALEPHLSHAGRGSGWTGPEQFKTAAAALRGVLAELGD